MALYDDTDIKELKAKKNVIFKIIKLVVLSKPLSYKMNRWWCNILGALHLYQTTVVW